VAQGNWPRGRKPREGGKVSKKVLWHSGKKKKVLSREKVEEGHEK